MLVLVIFGWSGGKQLGDDPYAGAKVKAAEMKEERKRERQEGRGRHAGADA